MTKYVLLSCLIGNGPYCYDLVGPDNPKVIAHFQTRKECESEKDNRQKLPHPHIRFFCMTQQGLREISN